MKTDQKLLESIVEKCDFSEMKKEKDALENKSEWRDGQPGMYRKGNVQDCARHCINRKYPIRDPWAYRADPD